MAKTKTLKVLLEGIPIGVLQEDPSGKHTFTYYQESPSDARLSLSMPRRVEAWTGEPVEAYIDGILPDDPSIRQRIARKYSVNARNPFALLTAVGLDCGGGVQFVDAQKDINTALGEQITPITEEQIGERLMSITGSQQASWQNEGEHWSLNGAQDKIALRFTNGQWYEAEGAAATTHIIKPGIRGLHEQAFNEYLCLKTAEQLGIPVAMTEYRIFGTVPAIVSERWDRIVNDDVIPAAVRRVHQEDLCQAMGVMTAKKYQSDGGPSAVNIVQFLRDNDFPEDDVRLFFTALVFNFFIAGSDAHAKNYAILEPVGQSAHLAPLYDIASLFPYTTNRKDRKLAMSIGGEYSWERIELRHWKKLAAQLGGQSDQVILEELLVEFALRSIFVFARVAEETLAWVHRLPGITDEDFENKRRVVSSISNGLAQQSDRVLSWAG
ncbi:transcriptional regulator [Bifidobacterium goeldii]|uniref:Transcriptional regulator n=1 Tax=Bifidobacterium goeldii TaxID=2306975 RepID=A0A430FG18_9BIFI|nr:type II toxin-antitoxin system HipA family toxin [Bifidobacterium goeldii]RSX51770.1 transcriptional regulator [Bifidobacterium goeldii]